jgi:hypothetical protein
LRSVRKGEKLGDLTQLIDELRRLRRGTRPGLNTKRGYQSMKLSIVSIMLCLCAAPASAWTFGCGPDPSDTSHAFVNGTSNTPPDRVCNVSVAIVQAADDNSTFTDTQTCNGASLPNGAVNQLMCVINARAGTHITSILSCNVTCDPP